MPFLLLFFCCWGGWQGYGNHGHIDCGWDYRLDSDWFGMRHSWGRYDMAGFIGVRSGDVIVAVGGVVRWFLV